jgi:hypothetical protein
MIRLYFVFFAFLVSACGKAAPRADTGAPSPEVRARAMAAVGSLAEDLAAHRPPAVLCSEKFWRHILAEEWASEETNLGALQAIEGQPVVGLLGQGLEADFTARFAGGRCRMRALLRNSESPCVLTFVVMRERDSGAPCWNEPTGADMGCHPTPGGGERCVGGGDQ